MQTRGIKAMPAGRGDDASAPWGEVAVVVDSEAIGIVYKGFKGFEVRIWFR